MKYYAILCAGALVLTSCKKSDNPTPAPNSTIAYKGAVNVVDEFGVSQADRSYVTVTVTDTNPNWFVRTDANGAFTMLLGTLSAGTHPLRYSFPGYGTYLKPGTATSDAPLPTVTLSQLTTTHLTLVAAKSGANYVIQGSVIERPTSAQPRRFRLFLTRSFAPAPPPAVATAYYLSVAGTPDVTTGTFTVGLTAGDLTAAGFRLGDDILVYGAGDNPAASTYVDATTGKTVYPASDLSLNPTAALLAFR